MKTNVLIKLLTCAGYILITTAIILAAQKPAIGYESSIYNSTPLAVWVCIALAVIIGIGITLYHVYHQQNSSKLWSLGLSLIFIGNIVILALPAIRDYYAWNMGGDTGTHLGIIQQTLVNGHVESSNYYPITHIFFTQVCQILGIQPMLLFKWILLALSPIYMIFIYLVAKAILPNKGQVLTATIAGTALTHSWFTTVSPNSIGNLIFPLALFLLIKSSTPGTVPWRFLFILVIILFPPLHAVPALALLCILLVLWLPEVIIARRKNMQGNMSNINFKRRMTIVFLLAVWIVLWISSFGIWEGAIKNIQAVLVEGGATHAEGLIDRILYAQQHGYSVILEFFKEYGVIVFFILMAAIALPVILRKIRSNPNMGKLFSFYCPLMLIGIVTITLHFFYLQFHPNRFLIYIIILSSFIVGFLLFEFIKWMKSKNNVLGITGSILSLMILTVISIVGVLNLYPSPYTLSISYHNTRTEVFGWDWYLHNKNENVHTSYWYTNIARHAHYLLSAQEREGREDITINSTIILPFHLGYDLNEQLGQYYETEIYIVLTELSRNVYRDIYPKLAPIRALPSDFEKIENDSSASRLYSNGKYEVYYITS